MGVEIEIRRVRGGMDGERRSNRGERGVKGQQRVGSWYSRIIGGREGEGVRQGCEWRQTDSTNIGTVGMYVRNVATLSQQETFGKQPTFQCIHTEHCRTLFQLLALSWASKSALKVPSRKDTMSAAPLAEA